MIVWIIYYFIGIYLTIINPLVMPEKYNKESMMLSIHILFTVPSSYKLAGNVLQKWAMAESLIPMLIVTGFFIFLSLFLSGVAVQRIAKLRGLNHINDSQEDISHK